MEFGFHLGAAATGKGAAPEKLRALVRTADEVGLHSAWISDHLVIPTEFTSVYPYGPPGSFTPETQNPYFDLMATLPYVCGLTSRLRVGTSVMIVPYRNPVVVAKWIASLDQLSGGRLQLGVGVGWLAEEFEAVGQPAFDQRGPLTDEYIRVWKALWATHEATFEGEHYRMRSVVSGPKPLQQPHPPIYVGGHSRRALRRAAELGDGWQAVRIGPDEVARGIQTLRRLAERYGRNPDDLKVSVRIMIDFGNRPVPPEEAGWYLTGDTATIVAACDRYRALGVSLLIPNLRPDSSIEQQQQTLTRIAEEVAPEFRR